MSFYVIVVLTMLNHIAYKGSKVLIALFALDLGANPFAIGILFSMYALFPVFLSVYAGKVSDRFGFRAPMLIGTLGLAAGLLLPYLVPQLATLYVSAVLIGMFYIFYTVAVQHLVGAYGEGHERTRYFSIYSLGIGITSLLGPMSAGFAIDLAGHRNTYFLFSLMPVLPILGLLCFSSLLPAVAPSTGSRREQRMMDLVGNVPLRRLLVTSGIIETGLELFNFYMPIYGRSIGLSASMIGVIMGTFATALLAVRLVMPALVRRSSEERVLSYSLFLAAATCLMFPFVTNVAMLLSISFVLGLGLGCCSPLSLILVYNRSPAGRSGEAMGLRQTVNKATEVVMPVLFGSVGTALGLVPVFWGTAVMLAGGAALMKKDACRIARRTATH